MSAVAAPPAALSSLSPAAAAVWEALSALSEDERNAVLAVAAGPAATDADSSADRPLSDVLARSRAAVLRWEREAAEGRPYTPVRVAGREVVPDGPPGPEGSGELAGPNREAA